MKSNHLLPILFGITTFVSGCLVLGAPRHVHLRNSAKGDSIRLTSFPNGFYRYELLTQEVQPDSVHLFDPILKKTVVMKIDTSRFYYDLRVRDSKRELLGKTVVQRFINGQHDIDTLRFNGSLRRF